MLKCGENIDLKWTVDGRPNKTMVMNCQCESEGESDFEIVVWIVFVICVILLILILSLSLYVRRLRRKIGELLKTETEQMELNNLNETTTMTPSPTSSLIGIEERH